MPQDNGARDANLGKRVVDQACLVGAVQRVLTISGTVEHYHGIILGGQSDEAASLKSWIMLPLPCNRTRKAKSPRPQGIFISPQKGLALAPEESVAVLARPVEPRQET